MPGPQPPTDPMIGTVLGHYKIVAALGAGGMGVVTRRPMHDFSATLRSR